MDRQPTPEEIKALEAKLPQVTGINVKYPGGLRFTLAFAGGFNTAFAKAVAEEIDPYQTAIAAEAITEQTAGRILARVYVRSVIRAWEADEDAENPPPPLEDITAAADWLRSDPVLFEDLEGIATDPENYRSENVVQSKDANPGPAS